MKTYSTLERLKRFTSRTSPDAFHPSKRRGRSLLWISLILVETLLLIGMFFSTGCGDGGGGGGGNPTATPVPQPPPLPVPIVMLDPGHGGTDSGAVGNGLEEKSVNLSIALLVRGYLQGNNCDVRMTRDSDTSLSLDGRTNAANVANAAIFVSIHANANNNSSVSGTSAIFADDSRYTDSRNLAEDIYDKMTTHYGSWRAPYPNECGNGKCYVLSHTNMPAVIVETLFISNPGDANTLAYWQDDIAWLIASGIRDYLWAKGYPVRAPQFSPVGSGGGGGLESWPTWWDWDHTRTAPAAALTYTLQPSPLWKWANGPTTSGDPAPPFSRQAALTYSIALTDLMPLNVLTGTTRSLGEPENVVNWSNALEAISADYLAPISGTNVITAVVVAFRTVGAVYAHDYAVCSRFKDGHLTYVMPFTSSADISNTIPIYFWGAQMRRADFEQEDATMFAVYVSEDEQTFTVDSHWMSDEYPMTNTGYILSFQVWAADPQATVVLAQDILQNLAARGALHYQNDQMPAAPQVFMAEAAYGYGQATLTMFNNDQVTRTVDYTAITWGAPYAESEFTYYFTRSVPPGSSVVQLPMPARLNGVIYAGDGGFVDKVYVADGQWFTWDDSGNGGASHAAMHSADCTTYAGNSDDLPIAGCATLTGTVASANGYIGLARAVAANNHSISLNGFSHLRFNFRGDGKPYLVKLETWAPNNGSYQYGYVITPTSSWQTIMIPVKAFTPLWGAPDFDPGAVKVVSWSTIGGPYTSVELEIDQLAFLATDSVRYTYLPLALKNH